MKSNNELNELSEILLESLASRPELLAKIKTHKGAAAEQAAPGKRISMKERKQKIRNRFSILSKQEKQIKTAL